MKSFAKVAVVGFSGVVLLKLFAMPMLGMMFGLFAMTVKFALIAVIGYFVYTTFLKQKDESEVEVEEDIEEVEVIVEE